MKKVLLFLILSCAIALPALGELTDADLNKIRLIVQEEVKPLKDEMGTLKTDLAVLKTEVTNLKGTTTTDFDTIQKNFDRQNNIIIACIGIPMAILAIGATVWGVLAQRRNRTDQIQSRNATTESVPEQMANLSDGDRRVIEALIDNQDEKIEALTQEIETLKQQRAINP